MCNSIWSPFLLYIIILMLFGVYLYFVRGSHILFQPVFFERDPTLSYPVVSNPQVSNTLLALLSTLIPMIFIIIVAILYNSNPKYKFLNFFWILIGFLLTLTSTSAFTNTIKILIASPRPNFFAICNYHGYNLAYIQNNFTTYNILTLQNKIGFIENCNASLADINDAFLSFPSGHASLIFSSMIYLSCIIQLLRQMKIEIYLSSFKYTVNLYVIIKIITLGAFILASWVAITRVQDYEHHTFDILGGAILGSVISLEWWNIIKYEILKNKITNVTIESEYEMRNM